MPKLCRHLRLAQYGVRLFSVTGPICASNCCGICVAGCKGANETLVLGGTGAEAARLDRCPRRGSAVCEDQRDPQRENYQIINGGSGLGTSVADIAGMLVKNWGGDIAVRYSGIVRPGDPFSLLADDTDCVDCRLTGRYRSSGGLPSTCSGSRNRPVDCSRPPPRCIHHDPSPDLGRRI